jgi:bile acid-coenzyme A ligase
VALCSYGRAFSAHAEREPAKPMLACDGRIATRGEVESRSNRLARAYAGLGVGEGDFVTLALPNGIEFVEAAIAIWKLGAVPQPISSHLPEAERAQLVELAKPKLVVGVAPDAHPGFPSVAAGFEPGPGVSDGPHAERVSPYRQAIASGGSTGRPKLIVDRLPAKIDPDAPSYTAPVGAHVLVPGPMYHSGPFLNCHWTLMVGGFAAILSRFDPEQALALIERHRIGFVNFVPTMLQRIWRLPEATRRKYDLSSLVRVVVGGAACPAWLMRAWIDWLGPDVMHEFYGASERIGGTLISGREWLERPGSVGRPTDGRKIRVLGPEGQDLPPGEIGELYMLPPGGQGSTYFYVGEAKARATADGWESIGDMGWVDADGYLYIADRRTDMIVTGGANVYPAEVEGALDAHPHVRSSAVVGLPDDDLGQRVHAILQVDAPIAQDELRAHLAKLLDRYKIPRSFEFVSEPLRDEAGKLRRSRLREERLPKGR